MDDDRKVECARHGRLEPAFVCRHLVEEGWLRFVGFNQAEIDPDNREWGDLIAWCAECEQVLLRCGEWNEEAQAFAVLKLVCEMCFAQIASRQEQLKQTLT